jgi:hypothetical protein
MPAAAYWPGLLAAQAGGVAVHGLVVTLSQGNLLQHPGVAVQHAGPIHHLGQVADFGHLQEAFHVAGTHLGPGRLERRGGHTRGRPEVKLKRHPPAVFEHVPYTLHAQHVADLVRVRHGGYRAVHHGQAGKLARREQRTFDVHVRIHEAGQDERAGRGGGGGDRRGDFHDLAAGDPDDAARDLAADHVHHLAAQGERTGGYIIGCNHTCCC